MTRHTLAEHTIIAALIAVAAMAVVTEFAESVPAKAASPSSPIPHGAGLAAPVSSTGGEDA